MKSASPCRSRSYLRPNRMSFEQLEARMALATHTWTGAVSNLWSNPGNWSGGSPVGDAQAVLAFPSAANLNNNNDLTGLKVAAIDFSAGNYVISGNPITLVQGPQGAPRLHMDAASKFSTLGLDLVRSAPNIGITFDVATASGLSVTGVIRGWTAATNVIKTGPGVGTTSFVVRVPQHRDPSHDDALVAWLEEVEERADKIRRLGSR